jgi:hypothetical protein
VWRAIENLGPRVRLEVTSIAFRNPDDDIESAIGAFAKSMEGGLIVLPTACRSSSGNSLCGQNSAGFRESARPFKGIICDDISEYRPACKNTDTCVPRRSQRSRMVDNGLGITLLPALAVEAGLLLGTSLVIRLLIDHQTRKVGLVWRSGTGRRDEFRLLAKEIAERAKPARRQSPLGHERLDETRRLLATAVAAK